MFFLGLGKFLINFWLNFCIGLTLFDMTIHLKTAIAVSEYMELIPGYLSLIQEIKVGNRASTFKIQTVYFGKLK